MPVQINRLIAKILNANNQNIDDVCHVFAVFLFVWGGCCCKGCVDQISFVNRVFSLPFDYSITEVPHFV